MVTLIHCILCVFEIGVHPPEPSLQEMGGMKIQETIGQYNIKIVTREIFVGGWNEIWRRKFKLS